MFMDVLKHGSCVAVWDRKLSDFIKMIFVCVLKMNESSHEGE